MNALSRYSMKTTLRWLPTLACAALGALILGAGCAGQQAPQGGPVDTEPPTVLSVYPAPNTVGFRDNRIALEFSEYVDRASVEKAVFISPYVSQVEFEWSGKEVEILLGSGLKANTTYVLTLGTDVVDYNNRNRMAQAFTLAFSTGTMIDRGAIEGRVVDEKPEGVMIFAYRLDGLKPDTLNPMVVKPDYITQTGGSGSFALSHLAFGSYRLFAVRDEYRDLLYTPEVDAAGTLTRDIALSERDSLAGGCNFTIALEDTSAPRLLSAEARDRRHVVLRFSEELDTASISPAMLSIRDTLSAQALAVTHAIAEDPSRPSNVLVRTAEQAPGATYRVSVKGMRDRALHVAAPSASTLDFRAAERPDTTAPALLAQTVRDTLQPVLPGERFRFDFSDALAPSVMHAFTFRLGDSASVPFSLLRPTDAAIVLAPGAALQPRARYVVRITYDSVRSLSGAFLKDSVRVFRYQAFDPDNYASLEGSVQSKALSDTSTTIIEAFNTADKTAVVKRATVSKDRSFIFPLLGEGMYGLRAFSDYNKNDRLDAGRVYPFRPSEPFTIARDTVKVRARWPVEGVIVR